MRQADVVIGGEYYTRVSGDVVQVRVVESVVRLNYRTGKQVVRFIVERVDARARLPKPRSASALHTTKGPW